MKYEYKIVGLMRGFELQNQRKLNNLGENGWELVSVTQGSLWGLKWTDGCAYLKRPIKDD